MTLPFTFIRLFSCVLLLCASSVVAHADTQSELRDAVSSMNSWLGADEKARRWRELLQLNILDTQAALGHRADALALSKIRHCFEVHANNTEHPVFARVKKCIDKHLQQLSRNNISIDFAASDAKSTFDNLQAADLRRMRDDAIYKIRMLKKFYKTRVHSRERALIFYEIRPDETVEFLGQIEFEVAPTRTRGDIESQIQTTEQMISIIDGQIKELNAQRDEIERWIEDPRPPADSAPPMPDNDDDDSDGVQLQDQTQVESNANGGLNPKQIQSIEEIDRGEMSLVEKKKQLQESIAQLTVELEQLKQDEKLRGERLRELLKAFNKRLRRWQTVSANRNDTYFQQAYKKLQDLKAAYLAAANPSTSKQYQRRIQRLQELNLELENDPGNRTANAQLGLVSGWLESAGQAKDLVAAVRTRYSKPNIFLEISSALTNLLASRDIAEYRRVNEQVLSRLIRGIARVDGRVGVQFQPDPYQINAAIYFTGDIHSETFTRAGKLTAYAGADAPFSLRREIIANIGGMFACAPYGNVQLNSYFKCIDSNLRLVQKIAQKQYLKTKDASEAISRGRLREQLFPEFAEQTETAIQAGFDQYDQFTRRQTDNGKLFPSIYMHTTADSLVVVGHKATAYDLAAPTHPLSHPEIPADIRVKLHESTLSNYISPVLADRRFTNRQIAEQIQQFTGEAVGMADNDDEEFSIRFDDARPIQFEFDGNVLAITISGKEFSRDGTRIRDGLRIRMAFQLIHQGTYLELVPAEEVTVSLIDKKQTNIRTVPFKNFLQGRLTDLLQTAKEARIKIPLNLIPTENLEPAVKRIADPLNLVQCKLESGWLYLGWKHQGNSVWSQFATDTPAISYPQSAPAFDSAIPTGNDMLPIPDSLEASGTTE